MYLLAVESTVNLTDTNNIKVKLKLIIKLLLQQQTISVHHVAAD